jgi:lipopolysaccharide transport system ATP-binding protein
MYVRLAFAVAAHLDTEILIVDEVLAVGDAAFQKKCMGKMRNVSEGGRTVLFVSHNMTAIRDLCNRAVLLTSGNVFYDGKASEVVLKYLHESSNAVLEQIWPDAETAPGNDKVRLRLARLTSKEFTTGITVCTPLDVEFEYWNYVSGARLNLSLHLYNIEGICVFNSICLADNYPVGLIRGICNIPGGLLNDGTYNIKLMIVQDQTFGLYIHDDILIFDVQDIEREGGWHGKWPGILRPTLEWKIEFNPPCNQ